MSNISHKTMHIKLVSMQDGANNVICTVACEICPICMIHVLTTKLDHDFQSLPPQPSNILPIFFICTVNPLAHLHAY